MNKDEHYCEGPRVHKGKDSRIQRVKGARVWVKNWKIRDA